MTEIPKEVSEYLKSLEGSDEILERLEDLHSKKQKSAKDWYEEFAKAEIRGFFPKHCQRSALNWGCCAIGARLQIELPEEAKKLALRPNSGSYQDSKADLTDEAANLGRDFYQAILDNNVIEAKRLFNKIHTLPRILKTEEEAAYDKLPFYKKWRVKKPTLGNDAQ